MATPALVARLKVDNTHYFLKNKGGIVMWVTVMEVAAWDGSIIELNKILDPEPGEKPYIIHTGLKTGEKRIYRIWAEAATWDDALLSFSSCIQKTIPDYKTEEVNHG